MHTRKNTKTALLLVGGGSLFGIWSLTAMLSGLRQTGWSIAEFVRAGLEASGLITPLHTMVDFYTHIKGIEYIFCGVFFVVFPLFFRFVDKPERNIRLVRKSQDNIKEKQVPEPGKH